MKTLILINGLPRAGKDTVADFLVHNKKYQKMSFAEPLKQVIAGTFDISLEDLDTFKNNPTEYGIDVMFYPNNQPHQKIMQTDFRKLLQNFGTEGMKPVVGHSVWADLLYKNVQESASDFIVVSDFRFLVEYQTPENVNVITVLVKDKRDLPIKGHASDIELYQNNFKFDYVIPNIGTLDELEQEVKTFVNTINT